MKNTIQIHFNGIHKSFQRRRVLDGVSLSLTGGSATLLGGENGSGKTTLLRILSGLEKPARCTVDTGLGAIEWTKCRRELQRRVMYLHQQPYLFDGDVIHNLALALPRGMRKVQREQKIRRALEWAQLENIATARAKNLSGGEKQRVSLARAWLRQSKILLLDEPIANMDRESQTRTAALLARLKTARVALVISSHNSDVFNQLIDRRVVLSHGKLLEPPPTALPDNVTALARDRA